MGVSLEHRVLDVVEKDVVDVSFFRRNLIVMKSFSALEIEPRLHRPPKWELTVRYIAAYGCMLMALGASWQSIGSSFAPILLIVIVLGFPVSLTLRLNGVRYKGRPLNRLALSSIVMGLTVALSLAFLVTNLASFGSSLGGLLQAFITFSAGRSIELMLGVFLIFGACRCLFILSDKDALLCSLPSFAVLLLLLVVQREPGIVLDFMGWTVLTAILLALEHRRESRRSLSGFVSSVVPGQDVKLSARSLATIMVISFTGAVALSYTLAVKEADNRGAFEQFLRFVTSSLNRISNQENSADTAALDSAPSNLIDYRSAPPIPTRTILWRISARLSTEQTDARGHIVVGEARAVFPAYWRMTSLGRYDGSAWTPVPTLSTLRRVGGQPSLLNGEPTAYILSQNTQRFKKPYFQARATQRRIQQSIVAAFDTTSSVPTLPTPWVVLRRDDRNDRNSKGSENIVRVSREGALVIPSLLAAEPFLIESVVSPWLEYGGEQPKTVVIDPSLRLDKIERKAYLELPTLTPKRVLDLAKLRAGKGKDALQKAQRLEKWVQGAANYTLRPPGLPEERDAVDFFLFESRRGYCTHFAGALTVLCRAVGIPARLATGFANPEREENEDTGAQMQVARAANAHAWTEIWIDGKGWIPLDATPADDRGDNSPTLWADIGDRIGAAFNSLWLAAKNNRTLWIFGAVFGLLLTASTLVLGKRLRERSRWLGRARALFRRRNVDQKHIEYSKSPQEAQREALDITTRAAIFASWNRAQKQLSRKYQARPEWQTPHDWIAEAQSKITQYDLTPLQTLVELHRRAMYDPRFLGVEEKHSAREALKSLSWKKLSQKK